VVGGAEVDVVDCAADCADRRKRSDAIRAQRRVERGELAIVR